MSRIFGIPADTLMYVLLGAFAACLLVAVWIIIRHRVIFRMAIRNIPRRPTQTILIMIGLMLSTTIIAAALTTGDIMQNTIRSDVFEVAGYSDEFIVKAGQDEEQARPLDGVTFPEAVIHDLQAAVGDDPNIDGMMPVLSEPVPVLHQEVDLGQPALNMVGLDFDQIDVFGGLSTINGEAIDFDALSERDVILGETPAERLDAAPGDSLQLFVQNQPLSVTVAAIAADSAFTGMNDVGQPGGFSMKLSAVQAATGKPGEISYIAVTNRGDIASGVELSDEVVATLRAVLDGSEYTVIPVKQQAIETAEEFGMLFSSIFMIFGMFSIAAGILLIFLIFVLLAAERKPEMGIARAIGMKRRQLTQMFMAEGLAYDLGAALIGAITGIGVAIVMVNLMTVILSDLGFSMQPTASWRSLTIAYTLGVTITFITIAISAWRVSRITIVSAIRNLPDPTRPAGGLRGSILEIALLTGGMVALIGGHLILNPFVFGLGITLIPFAIAMLLHRRGVSGRGVFSTASLLVLIYWLFPVRSTLGISPDMPSGGIEMFVISGLILVTGSTVLIMWNADLITRGVALTSRRFSRWVPAVKTAVSYPMANRGRTGLTIAMFSLIIFSLVMMASMNLNVSNAFIGDESAAGWDVQLIQAPNNPIEDLPATLETHDFDTSVITSAGRLQQMGAFRTEVRVSGDSEWGRYPISGANDGFIDHAINEVPISIRAEGYETSQDVWNALREDPTLAVVDGQAVPGPLIMRLDTANFELTGVSPDDETMTPMDIEVRSSVTGQPETITVIGVVDMRVHLLLGIYLSEDGFARLYEQPDALLHYAAVSGSIDTDAAATSMEQALMTFGVMAQSTASIQEQSTQQSRAILYLFEGFMALGLVVGIAALGVISFRAVVERRQQIGMLRAIGYRRSMLAASFVLESTIVTVLGVISGIVLGLLLAWQVMTSDVFAGTMGGAGFLIPWGQILVFAVIAISASLIMSWIPARQAARVPIAESLRYE
ncbi:MAG: ABC transporter permease [Sphaerobacteraceae bacterium]|nr:MAG: ABC transporter permease [Sphaerobacteraceae bacterium]